MIEPDEIYNLGAQSHVKVSLRHARVHRRDVTGSGTLRLLEAIRELRTRAAASTRPPPARCSAGAQEVPQTERTPFYPRSPYAAAKVYAYWMTVNYREATACIAVNGILFNHESPRRGETFVTRKITRAVARIKLGLRTSSTSAISTPSRDWGYRRGLRRGDVADAAAGGARATTSSRPARATRCGSSATTPSRAGGARVAGAGVEEKGVDKKSGHVSSRSTRATCGPPKSTHLLGDASKAPRPPGWMPTVGLRALVALMTDADLELAARARGAAAAGPRRVRR